MEFFKQIGCYGLYVVVSVLLCLFLIYSFYVYKKNFKNMLKYMLMSLFCILFLFNGAFFELPNSISFLVNIVIYICVFLLLLGIISMLISLLYCKVKTKNEFSKYIISLIGELLGLILTLLLLVSIYIYIF